MKSFCRNFFENIEILHNLHKITITHRTYSATLSLEFYTNNTHYSAILKAHFPTKLNTSAIFHYMFIENTTSKATMDCQCRIPQVAGIAKPLDSKLSDQYWIKRLIQS